MPKKRLALEPNYHRSSRQKLASSKRFQLMVGAAVSLLLAACATPDSSVPPISSSTAHTASIILPGQTETTRVTYKVENGLAVMDGDIILGTAADLAETMNPQGLGLYGKRNIWPGGKIPYTFHSSVSATGRAQAQTAMQEWMSKTDITFVERTTEAAYVEYAAGDDYRVCSSLLGASRGKQNIWLQPNGECDVRALIHEIGHAVGLAHEQNRADRDKYVTIHKENIVPGFEDQFEPYEGVVELGAYDYQSVMHYSAYAHSKNGEPTIVPKNGVSLYNIGNQWALSQGDVQAVKELYKPLPALAFSTPFNDVVDAVGTNGSYLYVLSHRNIASAGLDNTVYTLHRYDRSGKILWMRDDLIDCLGDPCSYRLSIPQVDAEGNVSVAIIARSKSGRENTKLLRFDRNGKLRSNGSHDSNTSNAVFAVAPNFDTFTAEIAKIDGKEEPRLTKSPEDWTGTGWIKLHKVGVPKSITLSPSGEVFLAGSAGLSKYSGGGQLMWTKSGSFHEVVVSGPYVYARFLTTLYKYDTNGKQLWVKKQNGLNGMVLRAVAGDASGNLYLTGKYSASSSDRNAFIRKLSSNGSTVWTKTFGTRTYDDGVDITTVNGNEIYVTGGSQGALASENLGGTDGYLRRLDTSGNPVWTR